MSPTTRPEVPTLHHAVSKRSSGSIFSRKGNGTAQHRRAASLEVQGGLSSSPPKNKLWKLSKSSSNGDLKNGTILRAVPHGEPPLRISAPMLPPPVTEKAVIPSPNDEILTAIGQKNPPPMSFTVVYDSPVSTPWSRSPSRRSTVDKGRPMKKEKSPDRDSKIGVWRDGKTHWDSAPPPAIPLVSSASDAFHPGARPQTASSTARTSSKKTRRPRIQVIIPKDQLSRQFPSVPVLCHAPPQHPPPPPPSASDNTSAHSRDVSPPSVTYKRSVRNSVVSPLTSHTYQPKPVRPFMFIPKKLEKIEEPLIRSEAQPMRPSLSNSSDSSQTGDEDRSDYSTDSSRTSLDDSDHRKDPTDLAISLHSRSGSIVFSIPSPVGAGVFDDDVEDAVAAQPSRGNKTTSKREGRKVVGPDVNRPLPPLPLEAAQPQPRAPRLLRPEIAPRQSRAQPLTSIRRRSSLRGRKSASYARRDTAAHTTILEGVITSDDLKFPPSPTLSEAEHDLKKQLSAISEKSSIRWADATCSSPEPIRTATTQAPPPAPTPPPIEPTKPLLPKRSSKRLTSPAHAMRPPDLKLPPNSPPDSARPDKRTFVGAKSPGLKLTIPQNDRPVSAVSIDLSSLQKPSEPDRNISAEAAESVIHQMMASLYSLEDLFSTAVLNKGFYRVFKRYELPLMRQVLRNMSAPAWEFREVCPPGSEEEPADSAVPHPDYTPSSYFNCHLRDSYVIAALKSLVLERCQSFLRAETAAILADPDSAFAARVDDAMWRIWTFCKIFGCGKGREEDIFAQMDWLKGGNLAHQKACRATIVTQDSVDISSVLANASDTFGRGNRGGLSAEELYDMIELWNCLIVLLQGSEGQTALAREYGVYDSTDVRGGDIDGEELMLEEWHHYLMTQGLSAVLKLAAAQAFDGPTSFVIAKDSGWMDWTPPEHGGSRSTFLKEALSRVYEEKIASNYATSAGGSADGADLREEQRVRREQSKERLARYVDEIRDRKLSGGGRKVTMSMERPMSEWEGVFRKLTDTDSAFTTAADAPPMPDGAASTVAAATAAAAGAVHPALRDGSVGATLPPQPAKPVSQQHPAQREIHGSDAAHNSADKAIFRIVEMGFTAEQARWALRMTDMGDGLRIDRAVELLLRS